MPSHDGSNLLSPDWITSLTSTIAQYGIIGLLVICLVIGVTVNRRSQHDFGWWLCWSIFGLCALVIIGQTAVIAIRGGKFGGGIIFRVPQNMVLYSETAGFYVAKRADQSFPDRDDYLWIELEDESGSTRVAFVIRQNISKPDRNLSTLAVAPTKEEIDPAPVQFDIPVKAQNMPSFRQRSLKYELHAPDGSPPYLVDLATSEKIYGKLIDIAVNDLLPPWRKSTSLSWIAPSAFANPALDSLSERLASRSPTERAAGIKELQSNFVQYQKWISQTLEDVSTRLLVRATIMSVMKQHFYNVKLVYPSPNELQFLTVFDYQRIILDGLDTASALGQNSRQFLNNARDRRILDAFNVISTRVFGSADAKHKSCLALFEMATLYNWAALIADDAYAPGEGFSDSKLEEIDGLISLARQKADLLSGSDKVQAARLDYLEATITGQLATDDSVKLSENLKRIDFLDKSKNYFRKFLSEVPKNQLDEYRYPYQLDVAQKFLQTPDVGVLKNVSGIARPEQGCTDPAAQG